MQPSEDLYYEYQFAAAHVFDLARLTLQQDPNAFKTILSNSAFKKLHESRNFKDAAALANYLGHNGYTYIRDAYGSSVDAEDVSGRCDKIMQVLLTLFPTNSP